MSRVPVRRVRSADSHTSSAERRMSASHPRELGPAPADGGSLALLVRLLQLGGQTSPPGWLPLLYATGLYLLMSGSAATFVWLSVQQGYDLREAGRRPFAVAFETGLFGTPYILMWLSLTATFVYGRRRFWEILKEVQELLSDATVFTNHHVHLQRVGRLITGFTVTLFVLITLSVLVNGLHMKVVPSCSISVQRCAESLTPTLSISACYVAFFLIPIKFALVASMLSAGLRTANAELKALIDGERLMNGIIIRHLRLYHKRLSQSFSNTTACMKSELMTSMFGGTICQILFFLVLVSCIKDGKLLEYLPAITITLTSTVITLVPPCLVGQYLLNHMSGTQDLLLELDSRDEDVNHEATLFTGIVQRDQEKAGRLPFYRLELGTLLSITSTILTYFIVMIQFYVTEHWLPGDEEPAPTCNCTCPGAEG